MEETKNIFHVTYKTVQKTSQILEDINVLSLIERHSKVSITRGFHTQKHLIHVNLIVCQLGKDFIIDINQRLLMAHDVMTNRLMSV